MSFKKKPTFEKRKLSIHTWTEEFKSIALENFEIENRLPNKIIGALSDFGPIETQI